MSQMISQLVQELEADEKYKQFQERLVCSEKYKLKGVRVGAQKAVAKKIAKQISLNELVGFIPHNFEELTVYGLVLAYHKSDISKKFELLDYFISLNDNWASNDVVTSAIKNKSDIYFEYLLNLTKKGGWSTRFAVTSMLTNFLDKEHLTPIFEALFEIAYGEYYVDMAVSWLLSKAYINFMEEVILFCNSVPLPKFVLKMTNSKIRDSFCVTKENKDKIKQTIEEILCKREIY